MTASSAYKCILRKPIILSAQDKVTWP